MTIDQIARLIHLSGELEDDGYPRPNLIFAIQVCTSLSLDADGFDDWFRSTRDVFDNDEMRDFLPA